MNGLLSKVLVLITLVIGGGIVGNAEETIRMRVRLPTYPQTDRDLALVQNFLIYQAFSEVEPEAKEGYKFSFDIEGELFIEGAQGKIDFFSKAFGSALQKVANTEIPEERFQEAKSHYLNSFSKEDLQGKELAEEIKWEDVIEVKGSIQPLGRMLYSVAASLAVKPELTLVSKTPNHQLFHQLSISENDQHNISRLIKKMADSGYWELLKKRKDMEKLGDKVQDVHPLRFIGFVYSHPSLKRRMPKIMNDIFKRRGFLNGHGSKEGFAQRMTKEFNGGNLMQYLPGFAQSVGVTQESIEQYFQRHDWEGLLRHLM